MIAGFGTAAPAVTAADTHPPLADEIGDGGNQGHGQHGGEDEGRSAHGGQRGDDDRPQQVDEQGYDVGRASLEGDGNPGPLGAAHLPADSAMAAKQGEASRVKAMKA